MSEKNTPLVSIVVITYNSSDTIVETLESIKAQTYKNIELIVSDDCSTDGTTVTILKNWLAENDSFFVRSLLVETPVNTGVAPNVNRGCEKAQGVWLKVVSGDDKLLPDSITEYVDFVTHTPQCNICFGKFHFWGDNERLVDEQKAFYEQLFYPYLKSEYKVQWRRIQETLFVPGPGLFYKKSLWEKVGGLDNRFPFADEYPFTYYVLEAGEKIYFLDKEVYGYQIREGSLCRDELGLNRRVFNDQYRYIKKVHFWKAIKHGYLFIALHVLLCYWRMNLRYLNAPNFVQRFSRYVNIFSPYAYELKLKNLYHNWRRK